jgi:hypothetical protein
VAVAAGVIGTLTKVPSRYRSLACGHADGLR